MASCISPPGMSVRPRAPSGLVVSSLSRSTTLVVVLDAEMVRRCSTASPVACQRSPFCHMPNQLVSAFAADDGETCPARWFAPAEPYRAPLCHRRRGSGRTASLRRRSPRGSSMTWSAPIERTRSRLLVLQKPVTSAPVPWRSARRSCRPARGADDQHALSGLPPADVAQSAQRGHPRRRAPAAACSSELRRLRASLSSRAAAPRRTSPC